jgi:hypothetical protein
MGRREHDVKRKDDDDNDDDDDNNNNNIFRLEEGRINRPRDTVTHRDQSDERFR